MVRGSFVPEALQRPCARNPVLTTLRRHGKHDTDRKLPALIPALAPRTGRRFSPAAHQQLRRSRDVSDPHP